MSEMGYAIITGGGRGIGAAMCREMAGLGYDIVIGDIVINDAIQELADEIKAKFGVNALPVKVDVSDYDSCKALVDTAKEQFGEKLAVLVNNAGIGSGGMFLDAKPEEFKRVLNINLCSMLNMTHVALPLMVEQHKGCIVHMSSASAINGLDAASIYCAAKGGVISMTKAMAKEFGRYGVRVNAIAPGPTITPMLPNCDPDMLRSCSLVNELGYPEDQSQALAYIVQAHNLTGQVISSNGGMAM